MALTQENSFVDGKPAYIETRLFINGEVCREIYTPKYEAKVLQS
jgi:hypothetical protein